jgi:Flp pilus assembly protein TadG
MIKPFGDLLIRFRKDERGVFLVFFALIAVVLIAASGAVVDFTRVQQARTRAQIALDAAALALQAKISTKTATQLKDDAQALLTERIADSSVTAVVESATPDTAAGKLTISGYIVVPTYFVQLVGVKNVRSNMLSEVTRSSSDLEVSLSIDITGSMATVTCSWWDWGCTPSDKIGDLIKASNTLIDLLVQPPASQTPTYSKMAIVPWSSSVNLGTTYAASVRGTPTAGVSISNLTWYDGTSKNISSINQNDPGRITVNNVTNLQNDDWVYISNVSGMWQINGKVGQIKNLDTTNKRFNIKVGNNNLCTTSGCGYSAATNNTGTVQRCLLANCLERVTTSAAHGIATGESVYITGTNGTSSINNNVWTPTILTTTTYSLPGTSPSNGIWTSGGTSYCVKYRCQYYYFTAQDGSHPLWQVNNCPTDRTTSAYTDAAPSSTFLGMNYRDSSGSDCITNKIVPLTSDKTALHAAIGVDTPTSSRTLIAAGSTAGHIGLAWGWYMISPNFAYLWPTASKPKAYASANLIKAVVFMTDGVFNTPFCNGVVANDALSGAGGNSDHINCASPNGSSKSQAETICTNIKAAANKTLLYVVGFDLAGDTDSLNFLRSCATSTDYFFQADDGTDLEDAFKAIAQSLSELRISK